MSIEDVTALDATFLELEEADESAHMHIGGVAVFEPRSRRRASDSRPAAREAGRRWLTSMPRFRQRLSQPRTGGLHWPQWVDDEAFDVANHVRQAGAAGAGGRARAARVGGRLLLVAARPRPAALGDRPPRRPRGRALGDGQQDPSLHGRRRRLGRHRPGAARHRARCPGADARPDGARRGPRPGPAAGELAAPCDRRRDRGSGLARARARALRRRRRPWRRFHRAGAADAACIPRTPARPGTLAGAGRAFWSRDEVVARPGHQPQRPDRRGAQPRGDRGLARRAQADQAQRSAAPSTTSCSRRRPAACAACSSTAARSRPRSACARWSR